MFEVKLIEATVVT